jgi:deoxyribodipyrimidine photo-lyase
MSSPLTAYENCSRLSPHFAFGTLSIREALQATEQRMRDLRDLPPIQRGMWPGAMKSFSARLRWHCHFIQKLEDAPAIEVQNMHPAYDGLRPLDVNASLFDAWAKGKTGYPLIDACMRSLRATGWLNFRMRAMVMSFSSYHLWQDWHAPALHLARMFTDYEPGIHYPQVQMQSGTTGINAIRIYNPTKQSIDQDPEGQFIRKWVPELRQMETAYIHTPWKAPSQMGAYPMPIVDEASARRAAADRLYGLRKNNAAHKAIANKIVTKHASRKQKPRKAPKKVVSPKQQELLF